MPAVCNNRCRTGNQSVHTQATRMRQLQRIALPAIAVAGTAVSAFLVSQSLNRRLYAPRGCTSIANAASAQLQKLTSATPYGNPLPELVHKVLTTRNGLKPGRLIIIGDVHGCHEELQRLLAQTNYNPVSDNLLLVGDLVNKGPDSIGVIRTVQSVGGHAVRGNHDDHCLRNWSAWKETGQLPEKTPWVQGMTQQDADFLASLPFSLSLPEYGLLVVHAGLVPQQQPAAQSTYQELLCQQNIGDLLWMRDLLPVDSDAHGVELGANGHDGNRDITNRHWKATSKPTAESTAWAPLWSGPYHVIFGHDAKRKLQTEGCKYATGLDTGCVYGGFLTAAVIPDLKTLTQMSPVIAAYANSHSLHLTHECDANEAAHNGDVACRNDDCSNPLPGDVQPVTREDLHMEIIDVPAARAYVAITG